MMVLLTIIAVGLLSLSAITLRQSSTMSAHAQAQANARLGLMIALGELQKSLGPDRAITATSEILSETPAKPNTTGVWESWWDFNPNSTPAPDYAAQKTSRFRGWLVSSPDPDATRALGFANTAWTGNTVELVGKNSLGTAVSDSTTVKAGLVPVTHQGEVQGSFAWHVADESVKARINLYRDPSQNTTLAQKRALLAGHRPDPSVMKSPAGAMLSGILPNDLTPAAFTAAEAASGKIISLNQTELLDQARGKIKPFYHDVTPYSLGVLSDVRGGGLKQDMSSMFEMGSASANTLPSDFSGRKLYQSTHGITGVSDPNWSALAGYYNSFRRLTQVDSAPAFAVNSVTNTTDAVPAAFNPTPVIAKVDTIFSLVARPMTDVGWIDKTRFDYFVDLIYTPVVTLHNPYNVNLSFHMMQVTFENMPVGFNFMLQEGGSGGFISKSVVPGTFESLNTMYQIQTYRGQKRFVLNIADWENLDPLAAPGGQTIKGPITLKPGQTLICGPGMKSDSSFYRDARAGYSGDAYNWHEDDGRGTGKITEKIKARPVFTPGIGFETSAVMIANTRPAAGMGSWCSYFMLRDQTPPKPSPLSTSSVTDRFYVEFKIQRPFYYPENLSLGTATLRTENVSPTFAVSAQIQATSSAPMIDFAKLEFNYQDQSTLNSVFGDKTYRYPPTGSLIPTEVAAPGGIPYNQQASYVHPFAIFSAYARTTNGGVYETGRRTPGGARAANMLRDGRLAGKPFLFHNPSRANITMNLATEKPGVQSYELNFQPFLSKGDFQDYLDVDVANRVPALSGNMTTTGIKSGSYLEIPSGPLQTIADFRRSNALTTIYQPQFTQPVGNSHLHPLMSADRVVQSDGAISNSPLLDHSVLANHALYDRFYFSTFATRGTSGPDVVFEQFMNDSAPLASQAFQPYLPSGKTAESAKAELFASGRPRDGAYKTAAEYQMIRGPFNVNSTSVQAWKAVLASMNQSDVATLWARSGALETRTATGAPIPSMSLPNGGVISGAAVNGTNIDNAKTNDWNGYRELTETQLQTLAEKIVAEVRARGPFLSMSEFVNRQIGPSGPRTLSGALESAIAKAEINEKANAVFPNTFLNQVPIGATDVSDPKLYVYKTPEATTGNPAAGAPGWLTQGDLLRILEPSATVRGDTFVIRSYGEAQDPSGKVTARAYAEAVVQRVPEYVDPTNRPSINVATDPAATAANQKYGRRFHVVSFRWMSKDEI
jgi:hypothetical protein